MREDEEICIHKHEHAAAPASKQEAGELHKQRACDVALCFRCHYATRYVHRKVCFS